MPSRHPVNSGLDLSPVRGVAAAGLRVISAMHLDYFSGVVFNKIGAGDEVAIAQPHLAAG